MSVRRPIVQQAKALRFSLPNASRCSLSIRKKNWMPFPTRKPPSIDAFHVDHSISQLFAAAFGLRRELIDRSAGRDRIDAHSCEIGTDQCPKTPCWQVGCSTFAVDVSINKAFCRPTEITRALDRPAPPKRASVDRFADGTDASSANGRTDRRTDPWVTSSSSFSPSAVQRLRGRTTDMLYNPFPLLLASRIDPAREALR